MSLNVLDYLSTFEREAALTRAADVLCSANVQNAIVDAWEKGEEIIFGGGTYLASDLKIFGERIDGGRLVRGGSRVTFAPGAVLKMAEDGFAFRTAVEPGQEVPTTCVQNPQLMFPQIDMNFKHGQAVNWECVIRGMIFKPETRNCGTGTYSYDDGNGVQTYSDGAYSLKGIKGVYGSYHNTVESPVVIGACKVALWLGSSPSLNPASKANRNTIRNLVAQNAETGVVVYAGSDNRFETADVSNCATGFRIGATNHASAECHRNKIIQPYLENNDVGVWLANGEDFTDISGIASISGTSVVVRDDKNPDNVWNGRGDIAFKPTIRAAGAANPPSDSVYTRRQAWARKREGNVCEFVIDMGWDGLTGTGDMIAGGLPFEAMAGGPNFPVTVNIVSSLPLSGGPEFEGFIVAGTRDIYLMQYNGANITPVQVDPKAAIRISGSYPTKL